MRNLKRSLLLSAPLLLPCVAARAQQTPLPAAPTPPPVPTAPVAPAVRTEMRKWAESLRSAAPGIAFSTTVASPMTGGNYLGARIEDVTADNMQRLGAREPGGVALSDVIQGSPAEKGGLRRNDVILRFEGEAVTSSAKLLRLIAEAAPESRVRLLIRRDGAEQEVAVTLGRRNTAPRSLFEARPRSGGRGAMPPSLPYFRAVPVPPLPALPAVPRLTPDVPLPPPGPRAGGSRMRVLRASRIIGITPLELTDQLREFFGVAKERGVLVSSVTKDSSADKAGLKAGDVITQVDETPVGETGDLTRALSRKTEGEVALTVVRDKTARTIRLTPQRRAAGVPVLGNLPIVNRLFRTEPEAPPAPEAPPVFEAPPVAADLPAVGGSLQEAEPGAPLVGTPPLAVSPLQSPW